MRLSVFPLFLLEGCVLIGALILGSGCSVVDGDYCIAGDINCTPGGALLQYQAVSSADCPLVQSGNSIRSCLPLELAGSTSTLAGDGSPAYLDGTGTGASFNAPVGLATDGTTLYVSDSANSRIRKIVIASGVVTTLAGDGTAGFQDGTGTAAQFDAPGGMTLHDGKLYVADADNHRVRVIDLATTQVTTLAGDGTAGFADGTGTGANFHRPIDLATDGSYLYIADEVNHRIRRLTIATGEVTTLAGDGTPAYLDGFGTGARFNAPTGISFYENKLYIGDIDNHRLRLLDTITGEVTTLAGDGNPGDLDGIGTAASFTVGFLVMDGHALYFTTDIGRVRRLDLRSRAVTSLAGDGINGYAEGTGSSARFNTPLGIVTDGFYLYIADETNHRIRRIE